MKPEEQFMHANLLLQQGRYREAVTALRAYLHHDPQDSVALTLLGQSLWQLERTEEAEQAVRDAIKIDPGHAGAFATLAGILTDKKKMDEAKGALDYAIRLRPNTAEYFALYARIHLIEKDFQLALERAEQGLALDGEDINCLNMRSMALLKLGRKEEGFETIDKSLGQDPANPITHMTYGWNHLEKGDHREALTHFREALRHDPNNEGAKAGMVEALKARFWFYRMWLRFAFWMSNQGSNVQWGVIIGLWLGIQGMDYLGDKYPALEPLVAPIVVLYILFVIVTWTINPLSNLFLRLNRYGRYALSPAEVTTSNYVGLSLGIGVVSLLMFAMTGNLAFAGLGVMSISMMLPIAGTFERQGKPGYGFLLLYTLGLLAVGLASVTYAFAGYPEANHLDTVFLIGWIGFTWVAQFVGRE